MLFGGFGGGANSSAGDETWEYDGATRTWTQIFAVGPSSRTRHAMAYDAARGKTMLFGGSKSGTGDNETWEYDGQSQTWTQVAQASLQTPLPREGPALAYDGARSRLVLFGGRDTSAVSGSGHFGDTWEYNGQTQTWTQRPFVSPDAPSARFLHGMAYDSKRRVVVLFGGSDDSGLNDETWQYNGRGWIQVAQPSPAAPSPRQDHAMAYDTARDVAVLFGGRDSAGDDGETWEYDVTTRRWTQVVITSATAPAPRRDHALAYDAASGKVVLFGGVAGSGAGVTNGETWEYDGRARSWTQVPVTSPDAPLPRRGHAMAADSRRGKVVLFGGVDSNGLDDETWEYDGQTQTWSQVSVFPRPSRRQEHAMAFDAARNRVVLFGGNESFGTLDGETWEYDGDARAWTRVLEASPDSPSPRRRLAMTYDAARGKVLLFGGSDSNGSDGESWEYDGRGWIQLPVGSPDAPSPRSGHALAYGSTRSEVVLFGGIDSSESGETWTFQHSAGITDACTTGFDGDADGLVGCDDPDCWGFCTPHCPVNSTPNWPNDCDTAQPRCGDGVCNASLETRRLCPGDCGPPAAICGDFHCDDTEDAATCPGDCTP